MVCLAKESLSIKRKVLERFTDQNLYPYSKFYLREIKRAKGLYWANHFSTIGVIGMNEACLKFLGADIGSRTGIELSIRVMGFIREMIVTMRKSLCF
jgi:anaerobic ribonucleoside-triphosphate reductase